MPHYPASYGRDVASQRASAISALLDTVRWSFRSFAPPHRGTRTVLVDADETRTHRAAATPVSHDWLNVSVPTGGIGGWQPTGGGIGRLLTMLKIAACAHGISARAIFSLNFVEGKSQRATVGTWAGDLRVTSHFFSPQHIPHKHI